MEEINDEFPNADVALVIGANDVVNPAARDRQVRSPIYGMPILDVDQAKQRHRAQAQHEPRLRRHRERAVLRPEAPSMLFGDAKASLTRLVHEVKQG